YKALRRNSPHRSPVRQLRARRYRHLGCRKPRRRSWQRPLFHTRQAPPPVEDRSDARRPQRQVWPTPAPPWPKPISPTLDVGRRWRARPDRDARSAYLSSRRMSSRNSSSMPLTVAFTLVAGPPLLSWLPRESNSNCASRASRAEISGEILFQLARA